MFYNAIPNNWFQGPTEKEQIDVQGDIFYDIVEFITDTWPDVRHLYYYLLATYCVDYTIILVLTFSLFI